MKTLLKTGPLKDLYLAQMNRPIEVFCYWSKDGGGLELNPPYQRGDVWGNKRRVNLIKSLLLGIPIPSIIINDRLGADWPNNDFRKVIIDGKQRVTTILMFLAGEFTVPREWFDGEPGQVKFPDLPANFQLGFKNSAIACSEARIKTLEGEKEIFDLVNFGGLQQGEVDTDI